MTSIGLATIRDVSYILGNLRPGDELEIWCQIPDDVGCDQLVAATVHFGRSFVASHGGVPVMAFGWSPLTPCSSVISVWAFGTRKTPKVLRDVVRFIFADLWPEWRALGVRRMEARSLATHHAAHRWMTACGASRDCELPDWGKNGEPFALYVWRDFPGLSEQVAAYCR